MGRSIMAFIGLLWLLSVHYGLLSVHYGHNGPVKAIIDRQSILEQNNVLVV